MTFRAIQAKKYAIMYSQRNASVGTIGELGALDGEVVHFSSESKAEVELHAKAYVYDNPNEEVMIVDESTRLYSICRLAAVTDAKNKLSETAGFVKGLYFVLFLNLAIAIVVGGYKIGLSVAKLVATVGAMTLIYSGIVKSRFQNYIEAAVLVAIVSVLAWFWLT